MPNFALLPSLLLVSLSAPPAPPPPPPGSTPVIPSPIAAAQARYGAGDYVAAAAAFHDQMTDPASGAAATARLGLAKALYELHYRATAKSLLLEIANAPADPHRLDALLWIAALSRELEGDPQLPAALAAYEDAALEDERFDDVRDELYFAMGRAAYEAGDLTRALGLLSVVPERSSDYVAAQYFSGVASTRLFRGQDAVDAFKNVLRRQIELRKQLGKKTLRRIRRFSRVRDRIDARRRPSPRAHERLQRRMARRGLTHHHLDEVAETDRYDELASLSMGYVFYQSNQLDLALEYFERLPQESPYWLDAVFAGAWTEFLLAADDPENANRHYQRTLGHVHTLAAPFFPYRLYPEAPLLEAVTYYYNCRYGSAALALDEFDARYKVVREQLDDLLEQYPEDFELLALYERTRADRRRRREITRAVVASPEHGPEDEDDVLVGLLSDRQLARRYEVVTSFEAERDRLADAAPELATGALGERLVEDLDLEISAARETMGAAIRQRLSSASAQIRGFEADALKIRYEILPKTIHTPADPHDRAKIRVDDGYERYAYNGEYWRDELANYHYEITSLCEE